MAIHQLPSSPVFRTFFGPVLTSLPEASSSYICHELPDVEFLEAGVMRCLSNTESGRDFIQEHGDHGRDAGSVDLNFKALKSSRRLRHLRSVNALTVPQGSSAEDDPFATISELDGFAVYAGDGHYHGAAAHDGKRTGKDGSATKEAVGHFFLLDLRSHSLSYLTKADQTGKRKREHDMHAIKRVTFDELRGGAPKGTKVILAWDKAGIDFNFWHKAKQTSGLYFISCEKSNMKLIRCGDRDYDRGDPRNAGVVSDENVGPGGGAGAMLRRITYYDAVEKKTYVYLTTEMTLPPGVLALIYKQRWDIEKVFDELKNKLGEKKSWGTTVVAKTMQAVFLCLTHNLLILLERKLEKEEAVENSGERKRREGRKAEAIKNGATYVGVAVQRFTVRSVKFIRWLRNLVYREVPWNDAVARLREIYATF